MPAEIIGDTTNPDAVPMRDDRPKTEADKQLEGVIRLIKFKKGCKTCTLVRKNKPLRRRIHISRAFNPSGKETLRAIYTDLRAEGLIVTYTSMLNHVKKHDPPLNATLGKELAKQIIKTRVNAQKKTIRKDELGDPKALWEQIIRDTKYEMEEGNITPTLENALKAAKDLTDFTHKQKDQSMALAKMVWAYSSGMSLEGLSDELDDIKLKVDGKSIEEATTRTPAENTDAGEDEPDPVYNGAPGDAATLWPSGLHNGDASKGRKVQPSKSG